MFQEIDEIRTHQDLAAFVNKLLKEYISNPDGWENNNLEAYLEALSAWVGSSEGYYRHINSQSPNAETWQTVALVLYAAKGYE